MTNLAVFIVTGVVIAAAVVIAIVTSNSEGPQASSYGRSRSGYGNKKSRYSPPPSPIPMNYPRKREKRHKSPERHSDYAGRDMAQESNENQRQTCPQCGKYSYVKILPCNHESLCKGCFSNYLENNDTCPACDGRIDSCSPTIPPFGKCKSCRKFTKLFKFLPCNHSLSLCISCFEEQGKSYKECPECKKPIRGYEPRSRRSGLCLLCQEFTRFAIFQPCDHGNFCRKHAEQYLRCSEQECNECGKIVMHFA